MIFDADDCEAPRLAAPEMNEQAWIVFLEDADIGRGIAAESVPEYLGGPVIFVGADIVKAARIRHPYETAIGIADDFRAASSRLCGIEGRGF